MTSSTGEISQVLPFRLVPTLPTFIAKYEASLRNSSVKPKSTIPALTIFSSDLNGLQVPFPQGWVQHIHPEGNIYYHNPETRVVTNNDPRSDGAAAIFDHVLQMIWGKLPPDSKPERFEAFINLPNGSRFAPERVVEYYVVDYDHRSIFWIEDVDILTSLGGSGSSVEPFESIRHLRSALEPEFWVHVEYYPCHQSTYDHSAERELTDVLHHGCVDDMTAPGSVCPYSADECLRYLKLLKGFHEDDKWTESYRRSWIARLWASFSRSRHINRHGLPYPRVDRLQGLDSYLMQHTRRSVAMALGEALCLGMSKTTFAKLTELWNGRIVYQRHWQPFLDRQRSEWRWVAFGGLYLLIINVIQSVCGSEIILVVSSASFTCSAIVISALMLQAHSAEALKTASDISLYISATESFYHGLRPLSIMFTLPKALLGYGILISGGNVVRQCATLLQDEPAQLLSISSAATLPLFASLTAYLAYGPKAI